MQRTCKSWIVAARTKFLTDAVSWELLLKGDTASDKLYSRFSGSGSWCRADMWAVSGIPDTHPLGKALTTVFASPAVGSLWLVLLHSSTKFSQPKSYSNCLSWSFSFSETSCWPSSWTVLEMSEEDWGWLFPYFIVTSTCFVLLTACLVPSHEFYAWTKRLILK